MRHRSTIVAVCSLSLILLLVIVLNLMLGEQFATPMQVIQAASGQGSPELQLIIQTLRAPRLIVAILVGAALAVSGAILQGVIRNPLAAPDVVGITGGASVGAVAFITYLPTVSIHFLPLAAIMGAALSAVLIYTLAWKNGVRPLRLVLVGVGISSLLSAITSFMLVFSPAYSASSSYIWLTGTVYGSSWLHVWILLPWLIVCTIAIALMLRPMDLQLLADDTAIGVGSRVQTNRLLLVAISVGLAGSAVSVGGVIGFVGLLAPHAARSMVGPVYSRLIPVSALFGGIVVALADLVGRTLFPPFDIPVGVFTSGIGAPFFIYLLYRSRKV
ncbi:putative siderophore transport system permease protein YfhA [compost metagenome]